MHLMVCLCQLLWQADVFGPEYTRLVTGGTICAERTAIVKAIVWSCSVRLPFRSFNNLGRTERKHPFLHRSRREHVCRPLFWSLLQ
jgi:hypothetical protein